MSELESLFGDTEVATLSLVETAHPVNYILLTIGAAVILIILTHLIGWLLWRRKNKKRGELEVEM